ncbi:ATP-binding protein [Thermococcus sp. AM4]|uniref:ATP-binding protein n=1 Tax=Thermococcus sp. (strain AM4) TaxID=246969 RepID=UPI000186FC35|nr:ATP-binding protein [Thermococcus sp. AM4]EEB75003.1 dexx-box ATPase [Thermococcus sp. AM4]
MVEITDYLLKLSAELPSRFDYARKLRKRFLFEELSGFVDAYIDGSNPKTVLLPGLRGTGKTTLLGQLYFHTLSQTSDVIYISADEVRLLGFSLHEVIERYFDVLRPKRPVLLLDEVQYAENWDLTLKVLHDRRKALIIATGSSALKLRESPDLARRAIHVDVKPLSFVEYLHLRGKDVERIGLDALFEFRTDELERALSLGARYASETENYLKLGSLPLTLEMDERLAYDALFSLLERIVYRDLPEFRNFDSSTLDSALRLLTLLATPKGERFSYEKLSKTLGISKSTVIELVRAFVASGLLIEIPPIGGLSKKIRRSPKLKFLAPSLRASLLSKFEVVELAPLLEDAVALYLSGEGVLEYEPGKGGADFVLTRAGKRYLIEVGLGKSDYAQVKRSMERTGADFGIVIGKEFEVRENLLMIPWWAFLSLV